MALLVGLVCVSVPAGLPITSGLASAAPPPREGSCDGWAVPDLDNDCNGDVVLGAPERDASGAEHAGAVAVVWAAGRGSTAQTDLITAGSLGFADEGGAQFGASIAIGYLDGDSNQEVIIGAPGARVDGVANAGAVYIIWGLKRESEPTRPPTRLTARDLGLALGAGRFGASLAIWGTLRNQPASTDRLVIGAPSATAAGKTQTGSVVVVDGHPAQPALAQVLRQGDGAPGAPESGDRFGASVSVTEQQHLVVGVPGEDVGSVVDAGSVAVMDRTAPARAFSQDSSGVPGTSEKGDRFGQVVTGYRGHRLGDETDVGFLASAPGEDVGRTRDAGAVTAFYGTSGSEIGPPELVWAALPFAISADTAGFPGRAEEGDGLGSALYGTIVGIPGEDVGARRDSGAVCVLDPRSFAPTGGLKVRCFDQTTRGITGAAERGDRFGAAVAEFCTGEEDHCATLALVGVPGEDAGATADAGRVLIAETDRPARSLPLPATQDGAGWGTQLWGY